VIAVGPGGRDEAGKLIPIDIKVGDRVLFGKWSGTEVKIDGEELLIMKESDVMGVIEQGVAKKRPPDAIASVRPHNIISETTAMAARKSDSRWTPATRCCAASTSSTTR